MNPEARVMPKIATNSGAAYATMAGVKGCFDVEDLADFVQLGPFCSPGWEEASLALLPGSEPLRNKRLYLQADYRAEMLCIGSKDRPTEFEPCGGYQCVTQLQTV